MIRPLVIGNAAFHAVQALWDERTERSAGSGPSASAVSGPPAALVTTAFKQIELIAIRGRNVTARLRIPSSVSLQGRSGPAGGDHELRAGQCGARSTLDVTVVRLTL